MCVMSTSESIDKGRRNRRTVAFIECFLGLQDKYGSCFSDRHPDGQGGFRSGGVVGPDVHAPHEIARLALMNLRIVGHRQSGDLAGRQAAAVNIRRGATTRGAQASDLQPSLDRKSV